MANIYVITYKKLAWIKENYRKVQAQQLTDQ
jgi:hypothetical protein